MRAHQIMLVGAAALALYSCSEGRMAPGRDAGAARTGGARASERSGGAGDPGAPSAPSSAGTGGSADATGGDAGGEPGSAQGGRAGGGGSGDGRSGGEPVGGELSGTGGRAGAGGRSGSGGLAASGGGGSATGGDGQPPGVDGGLGRPDGGVVIRGLGRSTCPAGPFPAPMMVSSANVCGGFDFTYDSNEGPTWVAREGAFFFSNYAIKQARGGDIIKYTPGGACEVFIKDVGCNGLAVTADGNLLAACQQSRSVVRFDLTTKQSTTVASDYMRMPFDSPNDLVIHTNGTIYFTNPQFELGGRAPGVGLATFRIDPAGVISLIAQGQCNGIALAPDEKTLYVLQFGQASAWDLDAQGVPSNRSSVNFGGDGMAVDCAGNVYVSGGIYSATGQRLGTYVSGGTNLAFGGTDGKTLLVVGFGRPVRELKMTVPGLP